MDTEEWRDKVGAHVEHRRLEVGFRSIRAAADAAGISYSQWAYVESGRKPLEPGRFRPPAPTTRTTAPMAEVLRWPLEWLDVLLDGQTPTSEEDTAESVLGTNPPTTGELVGFLAEMRQKLAEVEEQLKRRE